MRVRYVTRSTGSERVVRITRSEPAVAVSTLFSEIKFKPPRLLLAASLSLSPFLSSTLRSTLSREFPALVVSSPTPALSTPRSFVRSFDQPRCNYIMVLCRDPSPPSDRHLSTPTVPLLPFSPSYVPSLPLSRPPRNRANRYPRGLSILHACLRRPRGMNAKGVCARGRVAIRRGGGGGGGDGDGGDDDNDDDGGSVLVKKNLLLLA